MGGSSHSETVAAGALGFDVDAPVSKIMAEAAAKAGFKFAIRYLSRSANPPVSDLTEGEVQNILDAGLGLMAAQHVAPGKWTPSEALGVGNGKYAAAHAKSIGLPAGTSVWLDLEEVVTDTSPDDIVAYCNAWFDEVAAASYTTGVYIGSNCGLTGEELYLRLKTEHYWKSISTVPDIPHRGYCMVQHRLENDQINKADIDRNATFVDAFGGTAMMAVRDAAPLAASAKVSLVRTESPPVPAAAGEEAILRSLAVNHGLSDAMDYLIRFRDRRGSPQSARYWAIVNFDLRSSIPRLFLFDVQMNHVESYLCAHGIGSDGGPDDGFTRVFSNIPGSNCSSLGVYSCAQTYIGKHGYSLRIDGLEPTNSNARARAIVIHSASYVTPEIASTGRIGRSDGCFAVEARYITDIVTHLTGGSLLLAWFSKTKPESAPLISADVSDQVWSEVEPPTDLVQASAATRGAADLAEAILKSSRIILARVHAQSPPDNATAYQNIVDMAAGQPASRSPNGGAPGGTVYLDPGMLKSVLVLSKTYALSISEFCGGTHNPNSRHYRGCAVDINVINGQHVSRSNPLVGQFEQRCRDLGATEILGPGDRFHDTHVHAGWPRPN